VEEIGKVLPFVFRSYLQRLEPRVAEILAPLWSHVVGEPIAQHSQPVAFASGTLRLATSCPTWAAQLRHLSEEIRLEVNRYLGRAVVKRLSIRHSSNWDPLPRRSKAAIQGSASTVKLGSPSRSWPGPRPGGSPLGPEARPQASRRHPELDPEIARILEQSFTKYFSRTQSKGIRAR
jgi:hypothetical protein